jgi:adenylate cyclase
MDLKLTKRKISIRISIITLFVLLLGFIGALIIGINHFTLDKILLRTSQTLIQEASSLLKHRLELYLLPLGRDIIEAGNLLAKGVIDPNNSTQFNNYLYEAIDHNPDIYGVYWGTPTGDYYGIDRESQNKLALEYIIRSATPNRNIRYELDENGQTQKTSALPNIDYDPRTRPWYQAAVREQQLIWTDIYQFHLFTGQSYSLSGITAAIPIYNQQKQLMGVFGIDLTIDKMEKFINSLAITPNSLIYITDQANRLVALHNRKDASNLVGKELTPELIKALELPIPAEGLLEKSSKIIRYQINEQEYFAAYQPLTHGTGNTWHITIIVPSSDIIGPLKKASLLAMILAIISLIGGIFIVRYISKRISQPIIQLANEAKAITELNIKQHKPVKTIIK